MPEPQELIAAYQRTFASDDGVKVLADLKRLVPFDRPSMGLAACNKDQVFAEEAQRAIVLYIVSKVEANLDQEQAETAQTEERE